jgi:hypothetical protein
VHQVGDQPRLYYDARSTNHQNYTFSLEIVQIMDSYRKICHLVCRGKARLLSENNWVIDVCKGDVCFLESTHGKFKPFIDEPDARDGDG